MKEDMMTDGDVQREIEENQRRARDKQNVGLEEDVLRQNEEPGNIVDDLVDSIPGIGKDDSEQHDVEYDDDNSGRLQPES